MPPVCDNTQRRLRAFIADPPDGVVVHEGLSATELDDIQARFGFTFPPELRALLSLGLPVSAGFPDWRSGDHDELHHRLDEPVDGLCFDIAHNGFWYDDWGPQPDDVPEAFAVARAHIAAAPTLVPVYGHRYIPDEAAREGNPVFSVHQADIIVYGDTLPEYLDNEFAHVAHRGPRSLSRAPRAIRLWSDIAAGRGVRR